MSSEHAHLTSTSAPLLIRSASSSTTSTPPLTASSQLLRTASPPLATSISSPSSPSPVISTSPPTPPIPLPTSPIPRTNTLTHDLGLPPLPSIRPLVTTDPLTIPAQIHYTTEDGIFRKSFVFVGDTSLAALDLATTPYAFSLAMEHNEKITSFPQCKEPSALAAFFSYPWRREFPRYYSRNPSKRPIRHFPSLDKAVSAYERRILRPVVLLESRSIPIFFNAEEMLLLGPEEAKVPRSFIAKSDYWFPDAEDHFIDALDLWDRCMINIVVHTDCLECSPRICKQGTSRLVKLGECSRFSIWGQRTYERHLVVPSPGLPCGRQQTRSNRVLKFCRRRWMWLPLLLLLTMITIILFAALAVACFPFSIMSLNSPSGGALIGAISAHFKLGGIFNSFDRRICPVVHVGTLPCVIPANPDVAGIGGRLAVYIQTISLITLLALNPKDAAPSRFALAITSLAFGFSTLLSALANQLSLYHMILAAKFQTLTLLTASIVEIIAPPYRAPYLFFVNRMRWIVNSTIILWYSLKSPCFGNQPSCNIYVRSQSYFSTGHATQMPLRATAIFNVGGTLLVLALDLIRARQKYIVKKKIRRLSSTSRPPGRNLRHLIWIRSVSQLYLTFAIYDNTSPLRSRLGVQTASLPLPATMAIPRLSRLKSRFQRQRQTIVGALVGALPYPKCQRYAFALMVATLLISNIETTITLNTVGPGENLWTYGQILAVVLTVPPVVQVWQLLGFWLPEGLVKSKKD